MLEPRCLVEHLRMPWVLLCWAVLGGGGCAFDVVRTRPSADSLMLGHTDAVLSSAWMRGFAPHLLRAASRRALWAAQ